MHDSDDAVAVIAILVIFGLPISAWILSKVYAHQERMAMISRGLAPGPGHGAPPPPPGGWYQQPPPPPMSGKPGRYPGYEDYYYAQNQLRKGIQVAFIGLALLVGLGTGLGFHGPWILGGLIPLFVGIAQIVNAHLNGARLPNFGQGQGYGQQTTFGPPPSAPPPGSGAPQPPPAGPYGWRPGPTPEIERPVPPPDKR
jgi:hypothetical protein